MDNYTFPYWSDGKIQESVEFGRKAPLSALDVQSRLHDSAYAHYKDLVHRMAADSIYSANVEKLGGFAKFAGQAVVYGNQTLRAAGNLLEYAKYGPLGLIVGSVVNDYYLFDYMNNSEKYKKEVLAYYATDPGWEGRGETPTSDGKGVVSETPTNETPASDDTHVTRRFVTGDTQSNPTAPIVDYPRVDPQGSSRVFAHEAHEVYDPYPVNYRRGGRRRKKKIRHD